MDTLPNPPHITGPTWMRNADGSFYLPDRERTLGDAIVSWMYEYLKQPGGDFAGEPFLVTDEQYRFLLWWYAVDDNGRFSYRNGVLRRLKGWGKDPLAAAMALADLCAPVQFSHFDPLTGRPVGKPNHPAWVQVAAVSQDQTRNTFQLFPAMISKKLKEEYELDINRTIIYSGNGGVIEGVTSSPLSLEGKRPSFVIMNEALALDTPLPTPKGWTTMGAVSVGDELLSPTGHPIVVNHVTDVRNDATCFQVDFEDGSTIVASDDHLWDVRHLGGTTPQKREVLTTQQMYDKGGRFRVPRTKPLDLPEVNSPVDMYLLGLWLGDGNASSPLITGSHQELAFYTKEFNGRGIRTRLRKDRGDSWGRIYAYGQLDALKELGVLNNKHVPDAFLRGSLAQRLDLLRGLLDSDGGVATTGQVTFSNTNEKLAIAVEELLLSLGQNPRLTRKDDSRYSSGSIYLVKFRPYGINPFLLPHKRDRVTEKRGDRQAFKTITRITPTDPVPVRCVSVESDDHLFLAGRRWTTTHNCQWWMEQNNGHEMFNVIEGNITKSTGGRARYLAICNAHRPGEESIGERLWESYQAVVGGKAVDTRMLYDALEAPADTPVSEIPPFDVDPEGHEKGLQKLREGLTVARGDAKWLDIDTIVASILDVNNSITESRRKFLNQINATEDSWIAPTEWDAVASAVKLEPRDQITLGFDGSKSGDWSALVACRIEDGALFPIKIWNPEHYNGEVPREDVDRVVRWCFSKYRVVGMRADVLGFESYIDGWEADFGRKMKVKASLKHPIAFDMRGADTSAIRKQFAKDCEHFLDAVLEGTAITHNGDATLRSHILNAKMHYTDQGFVAIRKTTKDSGRKIDAAVTAVMAYGLRNEYMVKRRVSGRVAVFS